MSAHQDDGVVWFNGGGGGAGGGGEEGGGDVGEVAVRFRKGGREGGAEGLGADEEVRAVGAGVVGGCVEEGDVGA